VRLHYQLRGSGRDTLVVLHGGPGLSSAYLAPDLDILANDYTLFFYDQRGAGRSTVLTDPARLRLADHVSDLEAVRQHLGLERMVLLGHSWGAALAAHYARVYPDRVARLILVDAIPPRATPYMQQFSRNLTAWMDSAMEARLATLDAARRDASDPVAACREYWSVFVRGYFSDPDDTAAHARMHGDVCNAPPEAILNFEVVNSSALEPLGDWDWRGEFSQVRAPVLIIHGDKDPIPVASAAEWRAAFPEARLVILEGAGHFSYLERPEAFLSAVNTFLH
jgi:proline iminopeptidase